jgi:hypothetical protein
MIYLSREDDISSMSADKLLIIIPRGWISSFVDDHNQPLGMIITAGDDNRSK